MKRLVSVIFMLIVGLGLVTFNIQTADATSTGWHDGHYYVKNSKDKVERDKYDLVGKYLIDAKGNRHKLTISKRDDHIKDAERIAKVIGKVCKKQGGKTDLAKVDMAAYYVSLFCKRDRYTMKGKYYDKAYGVFIAKQYSCAGSSEALGMVLRLMGYKYKHVHKNEYTHQWCTLKMDGKKGYADGQAGFADYGTYFTKKKQKVILPVHSLRMRLWEKKYGVSLDESL